ncbi:MAG: metallophosphoesterase [Chloroflexi bacterium]|nr:metallophosphoesterase [Chloroflexota bacterium]
MRILTISDTVNDLVYSPAARERFRDVDLVLSSGDLPFDYIEYVVSVLNKPLLYVFGNHNDTQRRYPGEDTKVAPEGARDIHRRIVRYGGLLIGGLEGSMRYRPGPHQYSDFQMRLSILSMLPKLVWNRLVHGRALDILVTHAPPEGIHDGADTCHRGFPAYLWFMRWFRPRYLVHGHTHLYRLDAQRESPYCSTLVLNTYGYQIIDIEPPDRRVRGRQGHEPGGGALACECEQADAERSEGR